MDSQNPTILSQTIDVLEEICKENFQNLERYQEMLFGIIVKSYSIATDNRDIMLSYFQFFETMLKCEYIAKKRYLTNHFSTLLDVAIKYLQQVVKIDDEET